MKSVHLLPVITALLIAGVTTSCATSSRRYRAINRQNLQQLYYQMPESEMMEKMGVSAKRSRPSSEFEELLHNPYRVEFYQSPDGESFKIWYFYTDQHDGSSTIPESELTPVVLKDDVVVGWGRRFLDDIIPRPPLEQRHSYDQYN